MTQLAIESKVKTEIVDRETHVKDGIWVAVSGWFLVVPIFLFKVSAQGSPNPGPGRSLVTWYRLGVLWLAQVISSFLWALVLWIIADDYDMMICIIDISTLGKRCFLLTRHRVALYL